MIKFNVKKIFTIINRRFADSFKDNAKNSFEGKFGGNQDQQEDKEYIDANKKTGLSFGEKARNLKDRIFGGAKDESYGKNDNSACDDKNKECNDDKTVKEKAGEVANKAAEKMGYKNAQDAKEKITEKAGEIKDKVKDTISKTNLNDVKNKAAEVKDKVKDTISNTNLNDIKNKAAEVKDKVKDSVSQASDKVKGTFKQTADKVSNAMNDKSKRNFGTKAERDEAANFDNKQDKLNNQNLNKENSDKQSTFNDNLTAGNSQSSFGIGQKDNDGSLTGKKGANIGYGTNQSNFGMTDSTNFKNANDNSGMAEKQENIEKKSLDQFNKDTLNQQNQGQKLEKEGNFKADLNSRYNDKI